MALFNTYDITELKAIHSDCRVDRFIVDYWTEINNELIRLETMIRDKKDFFFDALKARITHEKIVVVEVSTIMSFNFSKVGGPYTCYLTDNDEYTSYISYAAEKFPESFNITDLSVISKFRLWKSKEFLAKLSKRLELPDNMHFEFRSHIVDSEHKIFPFHDEAVQYVTDLCLVVRFR